MVLGLALSLDPACRVPGAVGIDDAVEGIIEGHVDQHVPGSAVEGGVGPISVDFGTNLIQVPRRSTNTEGEGE